MRRIRPTTYIAMIALLLGSAILLWYRHDTSQLVRGLFDRQAIAQSVTFPQPKSKPPQKKRLQGVPVRMDIPSLSISLPIDPGYFNAQNSTWTLSLDKAHYATTTPEANNIEGNTFLYGHNRKGVFMTLSSIAPGSELIITTSNNLEFRYTFETTQTVKPSDGSVFNYQGPPIVTIQTCSGSFYQNRQMFFFSLKSAVEKSTASSSTQ